MIQGTILLIAVLVAIGAVRLLNPLPALTGRSRSTALTDTDDTPLGRAIAAGVAAHPERSGIHALAGHQDAFAARILLARAATGSLDLQYYIWQSDVSGLLLLDEVHDAADRGVRVRLLLDDHNTLGLDNILAALDRHRNVEVRLFNPFPIRSPRFLGFVTDFRRLNRRMHNKSFTADNQATIIGGRNVGDEYFGAGNSTLYADLDVLAVGPIVRSVSTDFDRYWASGSSYPAASILPDVGLDNLRRRKTASLRAKRDAVTRLYLEAVCQSSFAKDLLAAQLEFEWATTRMTSDDPAKGLGLAKPDTRLWPKLTALLGEPERSLDLVSAYFVPTANGFEMFAAIAGRGVDVRILTNAMETTDVPVVHAAYAKWRKQLLRAGVKLYELRAPPRDYGTQSGITAFSSTALGARGTGTALHAKTFTVDEGRVFIGSFNFDPRSANLNTELGFVIESPAFVAKLRDGIARRVAAQAYEVRLSDNNELYWLQHGGERVLRYDVEPRTTRLQRASLSIMSRLPIEWLL